MNEVDVFEQARLFLPKYLAPEHQRQLFEELKTFPENLNYYLTTDKTGAEFLQGDGWKGLVAIEFLTAERKAISGVILSNSCDIDDENQRALPVSISFAPLIKLRRIVERLTEAGRSHEQVASIVDSIRHQRMTSMFFFPAIPGEFEESVALLDDIHAHPLAHFIENQRTRLFRLSQYAFYVFLLKLSIHFSRFQEDVIRY